MNPSSLVPQTSRSLSGKTRQQLALLDDTERLIQIIVGALALQLKALGIQRNMLWEGKCGPETAWVPCRPDPQCLRLGASLMTLYALLGFQSQSESLVQRACAAGETPDTVEPALGVIVILIALIRLFRLVQPGQTGDAASEASNQPSF